MFEIDQEEVISVVRSLRNKTSVGHDDISIKVIKSSIEIIVKPLTFIMNRSFEEGIFPENLKIAIIEPIHKKGNIEDLNNFRPISILSSFSKIFEKVLYNRLSKFFLKFNVIPKCQHGFVKNRGVETAIFELTNEIVAAFEQDEIPLGLFLDLTKAFDCVEHKKLFEILENCGIRDKQLKLIQSYLTSRKQMVIIKVEDEIFTSDKKSTTIGLPQGSILGPLLFIIYVCALYILYRS